LAGPLDEIFSFEIGMDDTSGLNEPDTGKPGKGIGAGDALAQVVPAVSVRIRGGLVVRITFGKRFVVVEAFPDRGQAGKRVGGNGDAEDQYQDET